MRIMAITLLSCSALVGGCSSSEASDAHQEQAYEGAQDDLSHSTFEDVGDTSECTEDCSGHEAGFEWAKEQGVTDTSECSGDSQSFQEGCEAYASAIETEVEDDLEEDE